MGVRKVEEGVGLGVLRVREKAESVKCAVMCSLRLFNTASGCVRESLSAGRTV